MASETSSPLTVMTGPDGSVPLTITQSAIRSAACCADSPFRNAHQVTARYMAPVSRYSYPRRCATPLDTLDFPDPEGPSTATMTAGMGESLSVSVG